MTLYMTLQQSLSCQLPGVGCLCPGMCVQVAQMTGEMENEKDSHLQRDTK